MKIYKVVICYTDGDDSVDDIYWDKATAIRVASEIITDDEKRHPEAEDQFDYDVLDVRVATQEPNDSGSFSTVKIETFKHKTKEAKQ